MCLQLTSSEAFSLACLKLLALFSDLLKLRILLRMGSCLGLESRGESEGMGVFFLWWIMGEGVCSFTSIIGCGGGSGDRYC